MEEEMKQVGEVFTYFSKVGVAGVKVTNGTLKVGNKIKIKGATTDMELTINSMQINRENVEEAKEGDEIGIKVEDRVRPGDKVYLVE
jgi:putative protease